MPESHIAHSFFNRNNFVIMIIRTVFQKYLSLSFFQNYLVLTTHMSIFIRRVLAVLEAMLLEGVTRELRGCEWQSYAWRTLRWSARSGAADIVARYCRLRCYTLPLEDCTGDTLTICYYIGALKVCSISKAIKCQASISDRIM